MQEQLPDAQSSAVSSVIPRGGGGSSLDVGPYVSLLAN